MSNPAHTPAPYLYTDRFGSALHEGDIVKSYHTQFSDKSFILGRIVARGPMDWGAHGVEYLTIEVMSDITKVEDEDGDIIWRRDLSNAGTTVHPACVEIKYGGANLDLHSPESYR